MPLQATSGAASYDAFGGGAAAVPNYIEDVFSTVLFNKSSFPATIDGVGFQPDFTWWKERSRAQPNFLMDTLRGPSSFLISNSTAAADTQTNLWVTNSDGWTSSSGAIALDQPYASWNWKRQPKFFDVVTYTGNGANRTIAHNLGSVPGFIIVKRTDATADWQCYHRSLANTQYMVLNSSAAVATGATRWNSTTPTDTVFSLGTDATVNASGGTYVAYLFAHNAGGFGLTGTDNVISCGSFTSDASGNATVNLGYEPQWVLHKRTAGGNWNQSDSMRGMAVTASQNLSPNLSNAESTNDAGNFATLPTSTGFEYSGGSANSTFIYIAIRRGPMKVPTTGTSVFAPIASSAGTGAIQTTGFPVDMQISAYRLGDGENSTVNDRLRGVSSTATDRIVTLKTSATTAESTINGIQSYNWGNTGFGIPTYLAGEPGIYWNFRRAPGFFDEVCYTGDSTAGRTVAHNLAAVPELMIVKGRTNTGNWITYASALTSSNFVSLNTTNASSTLGVWNDTTPTASVFSLGTFGAVNGSGVNYVAYLFATCPGVSKVGSYTGTGTTQVINCGFTGGARFVLIKRTDSTGDWVLWDSSRGMVAGTDPRLALNSTAAEVNQNWVYTTTGGFQIVTSDAAVNASGGSYIYLSIA
jgi:hypothetical protein